LKAVGALGHAWLEVTSSLRILSSKQELK
jgi:hypothetical protein